MGTFTRIFGFLAVAGIIGVSSSVHAEDSSLSSSPHLPKWTHINEGYKNFRPITDSLGNLITISEPVENQRYEVLTKSSPSGKKLWELALPNQSSDPTPPVITRDTLDNIYLSVKTGDAFPLHLFKINSKGHQVDDFALNFPSSYSFSLADMATDHKQNIYLFGSGLNGPDYQPTIIKISSNPHLKEEWRKVFTIPSSVYIQFHTPSFIRIDSSGMIVAVESYLTSTGSAPLSGIGIIKLTSSTLPNDQNTLSVNIPLSTGIFATISGMKLEKDGTIVLGGIRSAVNDLNAYVMSISSSLVKRWSYELPVGDISFDYINPPLSMSVTKTGEIAATVSTATSVGQAQTLIALTKNGALRWKRNLPGISGLVTIDKKGNRLVSTLIVNDVIEGQSKFYSFNSNGALNWRSKEFVGFFFEKLLPRNGILYAVGNAASAGTGFAKAITVGFKN